MFGRIQERLTDDVLSEDTFVCICKIDTRKTLARNSIDVSKTELLRIGKKMNLAVGTIEPDHTETLSRFKRGKKAFGNHVEEKLVLASEKGLANAICGPMKYLRGDTFFNKWPVPVSQISQMATCAQDIYDKMFADSILEEASGACADHGEEDGSDMTAEIPEGQVLPFPHEQHHSLFQELAHVFRAEVLLIFTPGAGNALVGMLMTPSNSLRAVAVCRNVVHRTFLQKRLEDVIRTKRLVPGFQPLVKPAELILFEKANAGATAGPMKMSLSQPSPEPPRGFQPSAPAASAAASGSGLAAFGNITLNV